MAIEVNTKVSAAAPRGNNPGNLTFEDAKFFGRPNFAGEMDRFKDDRRKFTLLVPNELADQLRTTGWNVKTLLPQEEGQEELSIIKVMVDDGATVVVKMGDQLEHLQPATFGLIDRSRIMEMDIEIRAWMYNKDEVDAGEEQPKFSARLVAIVATIESNRLAEKYGMLT